jgi:hypothetical protein
VEGSPTNLIDKNGFGHENHPQTLQKLPLFKKIK